VDATRLLAEILAQRTPVSAAQYQSDPALTPLMDFGFVQEAGLVRSVLCNDCDQPHDAEVVFEEKHYGIHCPDLGFIARDRSGLVAIQPKIGHLVKCLAASLNCKRTKSTPIQGQTWRVGVVSYPSADITVYVQPTLDDASDLRALEACLARKPKMQFGIVLTARGELHCPPLRTLRIEDCLTFDATAGSFQFDVDLLSSAGAPLTRQGGRPSPYQAILSKLIAKRRSAGTALPGTNEEARAILEAIKSMCPDQRAPALSTIKRAIAKT